MTGSKTFDAAVRVGCTTSNVINTRRILPVQSGYLDLVSYIINIYLAIFYGRYSRCLRNGGVLAQCFDSSTHIQNTYLYIEYDHQWHVYLICRPFLWTLPLFTPHHSVSIRIGSPHILGPFGNWNTYVILLYVFIWCSKRHMTCSFPYISVWCLSSEYTRTRTCINDVWGTRKMRPKYIADESVFHYLPDSFAAACLFSVLAASRFIRRPDDAWRDVVVALLMLMMMMARESSMFVCVYYNMYIIYNTWVRHLTASIDHNAIY